jgi:hypothetical protein
MSENPGLDSIAMCLQRDCMAKEELSANKSLLP